MNTTERSIHAQYTPIRLRQAGSEGFTLVEMLLVMVVMAILATSTAVNLKGRQDPYAMRASAADLACAVRFAVSQARVTGSPHRVLFTDDRRVYRVEMAGAGDTEFVPVHGRAGMPKPLVQGVRIIRIARVDGMEDPSLDALQFYPDGAGFSGVIELQGRTGRLARLQVVQRTGQVQIAQGD